MRIAAAGAEADILIARAGLERIGGAEGGVDLRAECAAVDDGVQEVVRYAREFLDR